MYIVLLITRLAFVYFVHFCVAHTDEAARTRSLFRKSSISSSILALFTLPNPQKSSKQSNIMGQPYFSFRAKHNLAMVGIVINERALMSKSSCIFCNDKSRDSVIPSSNTSAYILK